MKSKNWLESEAFFSSTPQNQTNWKKNRGLFYWRLLTASTATAQHPQAHFGYRAVSSYHVTDHLPWGSAALKKLLHTTAPQRPAPPCQQWAQAQCPARDCCEHNSAGTREQQGRRLLHLRRCKAVEEILSQAQKMAWRSCSSPKERALSSAWTRKCSCKEKPTLAPWKSEKQLTCATKEVTASDLELRFGLQYS